MWSAAGARWLTLQDGKRQYTLKKVSPKGTLTRSAHPGMWRRRGTAETDEPARFSPDDKFSRQRITIKRRYGLLPMQKKTTGSI